MATSWLPVVKMAPFPSPENSQPCMAKDIKGIGIYCQQSVEIHISLSQMRQKCSKHVA